MQQTNFNGYRPLAVVTGASSGIGLEFAKLLAEDGHDLILAARDRGELERWGLELRRRHNVRVRIVPGDLSVPANVERVVRAVAGQPVAVLVNSAGFGNYGLFSDTDWNVEQAMIALNVVALTQLTKRLLPAMISRKYGRIVNVASLAAFAPGPMMAVYYATKAYVYSFSQAIGTEIAGSGITVTALCPGPTASRFKGVAGLEGVKVFAGNLPTAASVASYGYHAMKQGKSVAIPGFFNRLAAALVPLAPKRFVANYLKRVQGR